VADICKKLVQKRKQSLQTDERRNVKSERSNRRLIDTTDEESKKGESTPTFVLLDSKRRKG
jgi:hypothetical protein